MIKLKEKFATPLEAKKHLKEASISSLSLLPNSSSSSADNLLELQLPDCNDPMIVDVLWSGEVYTYVIPSFSVLTVKLKHIEVTVRECAKIGKFDAFIRASDEFSDFSSSILAVEYCFVNVSMIL